MEKGRFVSRPCVIPTWLPCKDLSFADSFVINKGNGSVTRGLVHLTEQWNFGEPIRLNNGNVAYKMSVTSKSSVILFIDVKSRRSYLTDKELSNVNCTGFVKQDEKIPRERQKSEPFADSYASRTTSACNGERETNLTTASHDSGTEVADRALFLNPSTLTLLEKRLLA